MAEKSAYPVSVEVHIMPAMRALNIVAVIAAQRFQEKMLRPVPPTPGPPPGGTWDVVEPELQLLNAADVVRRALWAMHNEDR